MALVLYAIFVVAIKLTVDAFFLGGGVWGVIVLVAFFRLKTRV